MILSQKEVAELLRVSVPTVLKYEEEGMPVVRIGEMSPRYDKDSVLEWFKAKQTKGGGQMIRDSVWNTLDLNIYLKNKKEYDFNSSEINIQVCSPVFVGDVRMFFNNKESVILNNDEIKVLRDCLNFLLESTKPEN